MTNGCPTNRHLRTSVPDLTRQYQQTQVLQQSRLSAHDCSLYTRVLPFFGCGNSRCQMLANGYELHGTLLEACSCGVLCPCWIGGIPTREPVMRSTRTTSTAARSAMST